MNGDEVEEIRDLLIEANSEISQALVELEYARKKGLLEENMDEIKEMVAAGKFSLDVILQEIGNIKDVEEQDWRQWNTDEQFIRALEVR